jgi:hypothetical protein
VTKRVQYWKNHQNDLSDSCLESDREDSRDTLNKEISSISKLFGEGVASYINNKLSPKCESLNFEDEV